MAEDDDTRYRIVTRRRPPTRDEKRRAERTTVIPVAPPVLAGGTVERVRRPLAPSREPVVTLPRRFGGTDVMVEDHGDHIAIVLPGALRLVGTRDEAVALAAALLHTVERRR